MASNNNTGLVYYTDNNVTKGFTYNYRVTAARGALLSNYSNTSSVTIPVAPVAPSSLTAIATLGANNRDNITFTWVDNSSNETSFTLQRADNAAFTNNPTNTTIAANTITTVQTGIRRGSLYYYRVQAVNQSGVSSWSNVVSLITP